MSFILYQIRSTIKKMVKIIPPAYAQKNDLVPNNVVGFTGLSQFIIAFIRVAFLIAGLVTFFVFIWGGFKFIMSGGDETKRDEAKRTLTSALIGFAIIALTPMIVTLLTTFFGIDLDLSQFNTVIR